MARRSRPRSTFTCPNCGADVPTGAIICPDCGADEETGWSENAEYDGVDLPEEEDDQPYVDEKPAYPHTPWTLIIILALTAMAVLGWLCSR